MTEAEYDPEATWPHVERRRPGYDRRAEACSTEIADIQARCHFCERAIRVISGALGLVLLVLGSMGIWSWFLQEHVWRDIQATGKLIIESASVAAEAHATNISETRINRAMSEKNRELIQQAIKDCSENKGRQ